MRNFVTLINQRRFINRTINVNVRYVSGCHVLILFIIDPSSVRRQHPLADTYNG